MRVGPKRCLFILYIGTHSHVLLDKLWPAVRTCSPEIITVPLIDSHNCWCLFPSRIDQWISNVSGGCVRTGVNDIDPHLNQHVTAAEKDRIMKENCCRYMLLQMGSIALTRPSTHGSYFSSNWPSGVSLCVRQFD